MKISHKWLKEYLHTNLTPEVIAEYLTNTGLEVEGIEEVESVKGGLKGIIVGRVEECAPHPNADKLKLTKVNIGQAELLQIVCGAPNVAQGQLVPVATVGTEIYTEEGSFTIKKSKLRGEVSEGMICSEAELQLSANHDGIMVLPETTSVGLPMAQHLQLESDYVYEIGLTPNRTDAMSHLGVARDLRAALLRHGVAVGEVQIPSTDSFKVAHNNGKIDLDIRDTDGCYRYMGTAISGVKIGPSPDWLKMRLEAIGLSPINNVVDVTNYVLHETGHPLHAFDAATISGKKIIVQSLSSGSKFTTLDERERELDEQDLMICNAEEPMVLAGIFGGLKSGVTAKTTDVFLESAYFNPVRIRKSAKRHGLSTDASFRYERGVDPDMTEYALKRAATLIVEVAGGEISMPIADEHPVILEKAQVGLDLQRMNRFIGTEIDEALVLDILRWLDIKVLNKNGSVVQLEIPNYRQDVTRDVDVMEEVLRIYGFNAVSVDHKMQISVGQESAKSESSLRERSSEKLSGRGFVEIMNNSLTKKSYYSGSFGDGHLVHIQNPLSQDLGVMRASLLFGGLESIARNTNRQRPNLKMYEFGNVYAHYESGYQQQMQLGLWQAGMDHSEDWRGGNRSSDFYTLKGELDLLLAELSLTSFNIRESTHPALAYGLEYRIKKQTIAHIGAVKAEFLKMTDLKTEVFFADVHWEKAVEISLRHRVQFQDLARFPEVRRDLALLLNNEVQYAELEETAFNSERKLLKAVNLFDVYEGKNLPEGKKSYALSFTLQDAQATLNDKQVESAMERILKGFQQKFDAQLR